MIRIFESILIRMSESPCIVKLWRCMMRVYKRVRGVRWRAVQLIRLSKDLRVSEA